MPSIKKEGFNPAELDDGDSLLTPRNNVVLSVAAEGTYTIVVTGQVMTSNEELAARVPLKYYISTDAEGDGATNAMTQFVVGIVTLVEEFTANGDGMLLTDVTGEFAMTITNGGGAETVYLHVLYDDVLFTGTLTYT